MSMRIVAGVVILFISVGVVLSFFLLGPDILARGQGVQTQLFFQEPPSNRANPIQRENLHQGTTTWRIPPGKESTIQIQAYASATSVPIEHLITFYVSTEKEGTPYFIGIYRIGWYGGLGGRLMAPMVEEVGHAQGYYDSTPSPLVKNRLVGCTSCRIDQKIGLVEAHWTASYKLYVPTDWTTGVYLAKFVDIRGWQTYVPFNVLSNFHSTAVAVTPDTTYEAYNKWGGYSLYDDDNGTAITATSETDTSIRPVDNGTLLRASKVSFDRPYDSEAGSSQVLAFEADEIRWMEQKGYDIAYISNIDLHNHPEWLLSRHSYISLGHDEYWTKEMRDGVERARDRGVGLAFLGANTSYWQVRLEPDSNGVSDRTLVCYKVTSGLDLNRDPFYGKDNSRVTARWRDPIIGRPENAMVGVMYSGLTHRLPGFPWMLNPTLHSPLLGGTDLHPNVHYGCALVGFEWDRVYDNGFSPPGLTVLGTSQTENQFGRLDISNTTYYIAPSGAMVFASGSMAWTEALDGYRKHFNKFCGLQNDVIPEMQRLLANVFHALGVRHRPGQPLFVQTSAVPALPVFTAFNQPFRPLPYGTPSGAYLLATATALLCAGAYVLRRQEDALARRPL